MPASVAPKKSLGQNWLIDETYLDQIVAAADLSPTDTVLEIGPGPGNLTRRLAAVAGRVIAVELDDRLIDTLRQQFAHQPQVEIVHGDILDFAPAELVGAGQGDKETRRQGERSEQQAEASPRVYKVVANLPYYIASAVLRHLLEAQPPPTLAVVMVQKEVAERICAGPGEMSLLAVSVQFYAQPRLVQLVPARAFYPRPKVDSAVIRLDVAAAPPADIEPAQFFTLVRAGFSQKRKQLHNTLSSALGWPKEAVGDWLRQAQVDPTRRAETLALAEWRQLYHACPPALLHKLENL